MNDISKGILNTPAEMPHGFLAIIPLEGSCMVSFESSWWTNGYQTCQPTLQGSHVDLGRRLLKLFLNGGHAPSCMFQSMANGMAKICPRYAAKKRSTHD